MVASLSDHFERKFGLPFERTRKRSNPPEYHHPVRYHLHCITVVVTCIVLPSNQSGSAPLNHEAGPALSLVRRQSIPSLPPGLTPVETIDPKNGAATHVESMLTKSLDLKPRRINSYKKTGGGGPAVGNKVTPPP